MSLFEQFIRFDDELAAVRVPPLGLWWRSGLRRWFDAYERGEALSLWACAGRGSAKSTALYKLAVFFALFGDFMIPEGERHYAIVLSRLKEEASKAIGTSTEPGIIASWLALLGIGHRVSGDVIELADSPRGIRVVAASVAATSGWRAFAIFRDERSKWASSGLEERDASEVDTSAAAMTATHATAIEMTAGSAWGKFTEFYEVIQAGDAPGRVVLGPAPTWIASDGRITEAMCRRKERDERKFRREYACEFQASVSAAFDGEAIDAAFAHPNISPARGAPILVLDPSSGGADSFTAAIASWCHVPQRRFLSHREYIPNYGHREAMGKWTNRVHRDERGKAIEDPNYEPGSDSSFVRIGHYLEFPGGFWGSLSGATIVQRLVTHARKHGAIAAFGDQRERLMLTSAFASHGFPYIAIDWTSANKPEAVEIVRNWMREKMLSLEPNEKLRRELLDFEERFTPSGAITFGARGKRHDDLVALTITAALAFINGSLPTSPVRTRPRGWGFPYGTD